MNSANLKLSSQRYRLWILVCWTRLWSTRMHIQQISPYHQILENIHSKYKKLFSFIGIWFLTESSFVKVWDLNYLSTHVIHSCTMTTRHASWKVITRLWECFTKLKTELNLTSKFNYRLPTISSNQNNMPL